MSKLHQKTTKRTATTTAPLHAVPKPEPRNLLRIASDLDGKPLEEVYENMRHNVTWIARMVEALHGDESDGPSIGEDVATLRLCIVSLVSLAEDVRYLRAMPTKVQS